MDANLDFDGMMVLEGGAPIIHACAHKKGALVVLQLVQTLHIFEMLVGTYLY